VCVGEGGGGFHLITAYGTGYTSINNELFLYYQGNSISRDSQTLRQSLKDKALLITLKTTPEAE
jgi:hypothetical protein